MEIDLILSWLEQCPSLGGKKMNWNYLPSYSGWSLTIPKAETRTDILGNRRERWQLKITRRYTIQSNEDRLAVVSTLEDLAAWAKANPPEHTHLDKLFNSVAAGCVYRRFHSRSQMRSSHHRTAQ